MAPLYFISLTLLLIPTAMGVRTIVYDINNEINTEDHVIQRVRSNHCKDQESLNLNNLHLKNIEIDKSEECFVSSSFIENINLAANEFTKIPTNLFDCVPNLKCLNVAFNNISNKALLEFRHPNLEMLIIDYQNTSPYYPDYSEPWDFSDNRTLPRYSDNLPNLQELQLNGLGSYVLDLDFGEMFPRLSTLYLRDNNIHNIGYNFLRKLPRSLEHLHLEQNELQNVDLSHAENLLSLYLDKNPFSNHLPLLIANVVVLSLKNCNLNSTSLDYFFKEDHGLEKLDLSDNRLEFIPPQLLKTGHRLQTLVLKGNLIEKIWGIDQLTSLTKLSLSYNRIDRIKNLTSFSLEILTLRNNRIKEIDGAFAKLPLLRELDLSDNQLERLPFDWAHGMPKLEYLNLNSNRFAKFAYVSVTSIMDLRNLYVKRNRFNEIDELELQTAPEHCRVHVV